MRKIDYLPAVALAAALPLGLLIGCGSSGGNNLAPIPPTSSSPGTTARTFRGTISLGTGQTGDLVVTRTAGGSVSGVLTINDGSGTPQTVNLSPVSGGTPGTTLLGGSYVKNGTTIPVDVTIPSNLSSGTNNVLVRLGSTEFNGTVQPTTGTPTPTGSPTPTPTPTTSPTTSPTPTPTPTCGTGTLADYFGSVPGSNNSYTFTETTTTTTTINGQATTNTNTADVTNSGADFTGGGNVGASTQVNLDGTGPLVTRQEQLDAQGHLIGYSYFTKDANGYTTYGTDAVDTSGTVTQKTRFSPAISYPFNLAPGQSVGPTNVTVTVTNVASNTSHTYNYTYKLTYVANESVTVPAGTFTNAAHIRYEISFSITSGGFTTDSATVSDSWFAKNVGTVKSHTDTQSSTGTISSVHSVIDSVLKTAIINGTHIP